MAVLVGETVDLVFDGRAVARPDALDDPGVHRRAIQVAGDDLVGARVGVGDPAADLTRMLLDPAQVGHHWRGRVARLLGHHREVDAAAIQTRRRAGLQATDAQRQLAQATRQGDRRRVTGTAAGIVLQTDVDKSAEEGAGGQHHVFRQETQAHLGDDALDLVLLDDQVVGGLLEYPQVGLVFQNAADRRLVQGTVSLGAGGAHRWPLAGIQHTELDAGDIGGLGHDTTQGVDFLDQMALADTANRRVAAHVAEGFHVVAEQQGLHAHARGGQGGLGTGMATADHDDVETGREVHHAPRGYELGIQGSRQV